VPRKFKGLPFVTVDAETDPFKPGRVPQPFIWGVYDGRTGDYEEFETKREVVEYLEDWKGIAYAHNGGKFDWHYLKDEIKSDTPLMVINGRMAKFKIGECEFRDSMNLLVNPLRAFAKETIDYSKLEPDVRHLHMDEIRRYLRSDCVNLWETLQKYFDNYGRGLTQAGAAMRYWTKKYEVPWIPQTMQQAADHRDYYYGGRVECFESGYSRRRFSVVDKNSAYPDAMCRKHPISPEGTETVHLPTAGNFGSALIKVEGVARGCFPWRLVDSQGRRTGQLLFPHDERTIREYSITGWELEAALEADAFKIFKVVSVRRYTQTVDFKDYIHEFFQQRRIAQECGDAMMDVFGKLFMNSLYGGFAIDPTKFEEFVIATDQSAAGFIKRDSDPYAKLADWYGRHLLTRPLPEWKHKYRNVATAASITGFVRAELFRAMNKCSGVMYCDTDSIAARDVSALDKGKELGQWKVEMECDEAAIAGKKLYAFRSTGAVGKIERGDYKTASKGVRLSAPEIIRVARGEAVTYTPDVPTYSLHKAPEFTSRTIRMTPKVVAPEALSA
jgi:DNA polymerase type B, organellar and viral